MPKIRLHYLQFAILAAVLIAAPPHAANAQPINPAQDEAQRAALEQLLRAQQGQPDEVFQGGGGGGRRATRGRGGRGAANQALLQGVQPGEAVGTPGDDARFAAPKDLIALNLWILTIDLPKAKAADDITASLVSRANDLPAVIASRDEVRILVGKLTAAGVLARSREFRVTALAGQAVSIQSGANQPQITQSQALAAARGGGRGGRMNSIQYQQVGTNITIQPRIVAGDNIDVVFSYNSSDQEEDHNVAIAEDENGNRTPAARTVTQQIQTTSRVKNGAAVLVHSDVVAEPTNNDGSIRTQLIILGANIIPSAVEQ